VKHALREYRSAAVVLFIKEKQATNSTNHIARAFGLQRKALAHGERAEVSPAEPSRNSWQIPATKATS